MGEGAQGLEEGGHRHPRTLLSALPLLVINVILFPGQSNNFTSMPMNAVSMSPTSTFTIASSSSTSSSSDGKQEPTT